MKKLGISLLLWLGLISSALAQSTSWPPPAGAQAILGVYNTALPTMTNGQVGFVQVDSSGRLITSSGGGSTSVPGFTPGGMFASLTATGSSASVALPAGTTVAFQNTGTTAVSCTLGIGSAVAVANEIIIQGSSTVFVVPGTNTFGACIDQTGSVSNLVVLAGGSGLGTGFGGGGGAVANASVNVAQFGGVSTSTGQVAVSTAPVTATNTALVTALRPDSPGIVALGQTTKSASVPVAWASDQVGTAGSANATVVSVQGIASMTPILITPPTTDPCMNPGVAKSSAAINITSATTTSIVAVSGSTVVYVCGFSITIAPSATTAATALFEYGTGAACTSPTVLTGTFGNGEVPAVNTTAPFNVRYGPGSTVFKSAASAGICILSAGNTISVQGVLTFVQQ